MKINYLDKWKYYFEKINYLDKQVKKIISSERKYSKIVQIKGCEVGL